MIVEVPGNMLIIIITRNWALSPTTHVYPPRAMGTKFRTSQDIQDDRYFFVIFLVFSLIFFQFKLNVLFQKSSKKIGDQFICE